MSQAKTPTSVKEIVSEKNLMVEMSVLTATLVPGKLGISSKKLTKKQSVINKALLVAAEGGKSVNLTAALQDGADPAVCDSAGVTALMHAAGSGSLSCVKKLLATASVGLDLIDRSGRNAWFHALENGKPETMEEIGRVLEERDKKKKTKDVKKWNCVGGKYAKVYNAIHLAVKSGSMRCVELAIKAGVKMDVLAGPISRSALMMAAREGDVEMVALLAQAGDAKLVSPHGETALGLAVSGSKHEVVELLAPKSGRDICDKALLFAAESYGTKMVELLIPWSSRDIRNNEGATPSRLAAQHTNPDAFKKLLPMPDPWARDKFGRSVLLYAVRSMSLDMVGTVLDEISRTNPSNLVMCVELAKALGAAVEQHGAINPLLNFLTTRLEVHIQAEEIDGVAVIKNGTRKLPRL